MKRRAVLTAVGAGAVGAGALVGTSGYTRVHSQRRAVIDVGEKPDDPTAISFLAFCPAIDGAEITIIDEDEDGDPIEIEWETEEPFTGELILKGGSEWYRFVYEDATSGTARMGEGELLCDDCPSCVPGEEYDRCPSSPCLGEEGTKYEADDDFDEPVPTSPACPPGVCP